MKKHFVTVLVFIGIFIILLYLQYGRNVKVKTSNLNYSNEFYEQRITVIANKLFITDKEKFAENC